MEDDESPSAPTPPPPPPPFLMGTGPPFLAFLCRESLSRLLLWSRLAWFVIGPPSPASTSLSITTVVVAAAAAAVVFDVVVVAV